MTIILPGADIPTPIGGQPVLGLVRDFCSELALDAPASVTDQQDHQVRQIVQIANRVGNDLCREFDWQILLNQYAFNTVEGQTEYDLPEDWMRSVYNTAWDNSKRLPMYGSLSPQSWAAYKAMSLGAGVDLFYRVINGKIVLVAAPPDNDQVQFEYISRYWVVSSAGGYFDRIQRDDDIILLDNNLVLEAMLLRWRKTKGLPFEERDYMKLLSQCKAQDVPGRTINLGARFGWRLIDGLNVPPTGFGGV